MVPTHFGFLAQNNAQPSVPGTVGSGTTATQGAGGATGASGPSPQPTGSPFGSMWIFLIPLLVLILMTSMGGKKQAKQRTAMLSSLSRNDRVLTSGGIIGTIVELYDQEMVLRVDESSNTKIRFARSAVQSVLRENKDAARTDLEAKPSSETANAR